MKATPATRAVIRSDEVATTNGGWDPTEEVRLLVSTTGPHKVFSPKRPQARPDPITLREVAIVIGVVAIGLRILPCPLDSMTAFVIPPFYFLARVWPQALRLLGMFGYVAWVAVPFVPALGVASCLYLMLGLPWITWLRFALWLIAGLVIYFLYGYKRSRLRLARSD